MKTLEECTLGELKSLAYDEIRKFEVAKSNLDLINNQIRKMEEYKTPEEVEALPTEEEIDATVDELVAEEQI